MVYRRRYKLTKKIQRHAWLFIPLTAVGGLWIPKLGLLIIPLMLTLMVMGVFRGKYWCGNICPHGSLFDRFIALFSFKRRIPIILKSTISRVLLFSWFGYMMVARISSVVHLWGGMDFWDRLGFIFVSNYLMVTIVGSLLAWLVAPRAWCSICPMGTMQKLTYGAGRLSGVNTTTDKVITVEDENKCISCAACARACPMQLEPFKNFKDNKFKDSDCIRCSACVASCPVKILSLSGESQGLKQTG